MLIQLMVKVPGTSKVIALNGLNASKECCGRKSNVHWCDLDGEEDSVNTVYLPAIEKVKIKIG
jgi:hypothetical protein